MHARTVRAFLATLPFVLAAACGGRGPAPAPPAGGGEITNRIPIPADVVSNLGITFEKAKRGRLEARLRVPGHLEVAPDARFAVRSPAAGRLTLKATRWQKVGRGHVVAELVSPELRSAQQALADAEAEAARVAVEIVRDRAEVAPLAGLADAAAVSLEAAKGRERESEAALAAARDLEEAAQARLEASERLAAENGLAAGAVFAARKDRVDAMTARIEATRRRDEARDDIAEQALKVAVARARAETVAQDLAVLERRRASLEAGARQHLRTLAVLAGSTPEALAAQRDGGPAWARLEVVPIPAPADGILTEVAVTDGEWVEAGAYLLRVVDASRMIFRGEVPESDVARIPPGASARIEVGDRARGAFETMLEAARPLADPRTRTVLLEARVPGDASAYPDGASATAAILVGRSAAEEVLVPAACVVRDDLETIVFRRDPERPEQVIRTPVALGMQSDGWVEVLAEVAEGDALVRDGVHQLRLTGRGKAAGSGHFHADGSWHEGKD